MVARATASIRVWWVLIDKKIGNCIGRYNSNMRGRSPKKLFEPPISFMIHVTENVLEFTEFLQIFNFKCL